MISQRRSLVAITFSIAATLVAGCAVSTKVSSEYWGAKPTLIEVADPPTHVPPRLNVYLHPTDGARAKVEPPFRTSMGIALGSGSDPWLATVGAQQAAYQSALLGVLEKSGKSCTVTKATPHPDLFMFEFVYRCDESD